MLNLKNKIEFEDNLWLAEVDASIFNSSQENRIKAVTDIASITKGRLGFNINQDVDKSIYPIATLGENIKSRKRLYNKLLVESAGNPSSPFEFIPVKIDFNLPLIQNLPNNLFYNYVTRFSYYIVENKNYESKEYLLTNLRTLLNVEIKLDDVPFNKPEELKGYKIIVGNVPAKVFPHHLRTHRLISPMSESSRNKKYLNEVEFWYPNNWKNKTKQRWKNLDNQLIEILHEQISDKMLKPEEATMELSDRRLVTFAYGAWQQDELAWDNLFKVRGDKTGTQSITKTVVDNIKKLIYDI